MQNPWPEQSGSEQSTKFKSSTVENLFEFVFRICAPTFLAKFSGESLDALARALLADAVAVAVGDLALLVPQVALLALPAGVAVAAAVDVIPVTIAKQRANT